MCSHLPPRRRWAPRTREVVVAALTAAAAVAAAASTATAAPPAILTQPKANVTASVGDRVTLTVVVAPPTTAVITWQRSRTPGPSPYWVNVPGGTGSSLTASVACPIYGAVEQYRAVVCNLDGCRTSEASRWGQVTLRAPTWVATPAPRAAEGANLTWVARAPFASLIIVGLRRTDAEGVGQRVSGLALKLPRVKDESGVVLRGAPRGAQYWGVASAICGGNHGLRSDTTFSAVTIVSAKSDPSTPSPPVVSPDTDPLTRMCPASVRAVAEDYDGYVLNNGAKFSTPTCVACRNACRRAPGCDTWVYGAAAADAARHRQCWLKKAFPGTTGPTVKRPSTEAERDRPSPWVAGTLPSPWRCPGKFTADYDGRLLVRGDANLQPTCVACRNACRAAAGCNVWVWGFRGIGSTRHRQCWLKRWEGGGRPALKAGSWSPDSDWLGGVLDDRL